MQKIKYSENIIAQWKSQNIPENIDRLHRYYYRSVPIVFGFIFPGTYMIFNTSILKLQILGLLLAITGISVGILMKSWMHNKLSMLRVIWELQSQRK
jgi:hypothetical protein